jgi:hypothetical protein
MAGNVLTRKVGPLPTWGWLAIATGAAGAFYLYEKHKQAGTGSVNASNVPDYVFQNYNELPPAAPPPKKKHGGGTSTREKQEAAQLDRLQRRVSGLEHGVAMTRKQSRSRKGEKQAYREHRHPGGRPRHHRRREVNPGGPERPARAKARR